MNSISSFYTSLKLPENILLFSGVVAAFHLGKVTPALSYLESDLGMTASQAAFLLSAIQISGALIGVVMGFLTDGIGSRRSIIYGHAILILCSVVGTLGTKISSLLFIRIIESIGFLMITISTPKLIRAVVSECKLQFRLGLWGCYIALGSSTAFAIGPYFIIKWGWEIWWYLSALLSAISFILVAKLIPVDSKQRNIDRIRSNFRKTVQINLLPVLTNIKPWLIGFAFALYAGQWLSIVGLLPIICKDYYLSSQDMGVLTAIASLANIIGNVVAAISIQKKVKFQTLTVTAYFAMVAFSAIALSGNTLNLSLESKYVSVVLFSLFGGILPATLFNLAFTVAINERYISTTFGLIQQITSIGMVCSPPLFAYFNAQNISYSLFFTCSSLFMSLLCLYFVTRNQVLLKSYF